MALANTQDTSFPYARFNEDYLRSEDECVARLSSMVQLSDVDRANIHALAVNYIRTGREKAGHGTLFDAFLQEYGLSNDEGITLMRLAESLIRTPDSENAHRLVRDKLSGHDWSAHKQKSKSGLVNLATHGLSFSAAWVNVTGGKKAANLIAKLGDRVLDKAVSVAMSIMSEHFVLGYDIDNAVKKSKPFAKDGFTFSYDMLGEAAHTLEDAERYRQSYLNAIRTLAKDTGSNASPQTASGISVKLSALHPRYEFAKRGDCVPALTAIVKEMALLSRAANMGLTIDAEEADRLEVSLLIAEALIRDDDLKDWDGLSIVVQAYQRRAVTVIEHLLSIARNARRKFSIRLVKGAYWDSEIKRAQEMGLSSYPVFTRKENTDVSYLACAKLLLNNRDIVYPQFATHNAASIAAVLNMAGNQKGFEFQRLHGMGELLHKDVMARTAIQSRIYAPVGAHKDLLPYLVRRLLENGANSSFVNQFLDEDINPEDMARDPIAQVQSNSSAQNPLIPAPRDQFSGERLAAIGVDTTQGVSEAYLEKALAAYKPIKAKSIIKGRDVSGDKSPVYNPANLREKVGEAHGLKASKLQAALKSSQKSKWIESFTPKQRADILMKFADALEAQTHEFMAVCVKEAGKTWLDAVAEVREAVDFCRYYARQIHATEFTSREGLGVIACISPWNFPLAIFLGQVTASLAAGNAVICKPAEQTPLIAYKAVKLLHKCGVPKDALHLVLGAGSVIGAALVAAPEISGVCFTGSTLTAKRITKTLADTGRPQTPIIAETGGLNAMIIDSTALLEQAVSDVVASAFQSAGQRCSACRFVCVQDDIADDFIKMLKGSMDVLRLGDPSKLNTDVGPVIDQGALKMLSDYRANKESQWSVVGACEQELTHLNGHFFNPIAFEIPSIDALKDEKFGPVLHILRFKASEVEALIHEINALGYGLTMGLHTRIDSRVETVSALADVGNLYVNRNQIGAVVGVQPFGGHGLSGTGPKAGGPLYLKRLSRKIMTAPDTGSSLETSLLNSMSHEGATEGIDFSAIKAAQHLWAAQDRSPVLTQALAAMDSLPPQTLEACKHIISQTHDMMQMQNLPGPTGEANRLSFHARGVMLMLADRDEPSNIVQLVKILAAGNAAIVYGAADQIVPILALSKALNPTDLITCINMADEVIPLALEIDAIVSGGIDQNEIAAHLCQRDGAILPLLTPHDDLERYIVERTRTIDTTAAGGNASLLAL